MLAGWLTATSARRHRAARPDGERIGNFAYRSMDSEMRLDKIIGRTSNPGSPGVELMAASPGRRAMPAERFDFTNAAKAIALPPCSTIQQTQPRAYALFVHCFTCGKDSHAARRIAEGLKALRHRRSAVRLHRARRKRRGVRQHHVLFKCRRSRRGSRPIAEQQARPGDPYRTQPRRRRGSGGRFAATGSPGGSDYWRAVRSGPRHRIVQGQACRDR